MKTKKRNVKKTIFYDNSPNLLPKQLGEIKVKKTYKYISVKCKNCKICFSKYHSTKNCYWKNKEELACEILLSLKYFKFDFNL